MKSNSMKWLALMLALVMVMGVTACSNNNATTPTQSPATQSTTDATQAPAADPTQAPATTDTDATLTEEDIVPLKNFGGMNITLSDWWTNNEAVEEPATTLREEEWRDYRDGIFADYNFTLTQKSVADWNGYMETFTTSVMAQDPASDIFIMGSSWAMQLAMQGLLYPLDTLDSINLTDTKWNKTISDLYTINGSTLAITNQKYLEPRNFLFFNKRLFAEAGIDPDEIYELQANGQWTWDKFMEYCEKLTRDTDNDGIYDTYGYVGFEQETAAGFVFSNNAQYINRNADGTYYNAMSEPNFLEAIQFAKNIYDRGYWAPDPEGASWDWFVTGFHDAYAAMIIREAYCTGTWADMEDDWGMVYPPKGPKAKDYNTNFSENVYVMPFNISKEKAEDFMYAFNLYTEPLSYDLQHPDYWKDGGWGYQRFRDTRSVDDTLAMYYDGKYTANFRDFVPNIDWGPTYDWGCMKGAETVSEKVDAAKPVVDNAVNESNASLK